MSARPRRADRAVQAIEPSLDGIQSFFGSSLAFAPDASFFVASAPFAPFPGCTRCETFFIYRLVDGVWTLAHAEPGLFGATDGFFALRGTCGRGERRGSPLGAGSPLNVSTRAATRFRLKSWGSTWGLNSDLNSPDRGDVLQIRAGAKDGTAWTFG